MVVAYRWVAALALGSCVAAGSACARSDKLDAAGGSGGGTENGAGTSDGGTGNTGLISSQGGTDPTTSTTEPTTTTMGPTCTEAPCKLVAPQCGCDMGQACTVDTNGGRVCGNTGPGTQGQICDESSLCQPGLFCVGYPDHDLTCMTFCENDDDCAGGGSRCALEYMGAPLCSERCNLITSSGCLSDGLSCQVGVETNEGFTLCAPGGSGVAQGICGTTDPDQSLCAPGFVCLPTSVPDNRCFEWCDVDNPDCPAEQPNCTGLDVAENVPLMIGGTHYGVCNP